MPGGGPRIKPWAVKIVGRIRRRRHRVYVRYWPITVLGLLECALAEDEPFRTANSVEICAKNQV